MNEKLKQAEQLIIEATKSGDADKLAEAYREYSNVLLEELKKEAQMRNVMNDSVVLANRGVHQLTNEEKEFYQKVSDALRSENPKEALTKIEVTFPETVIDSIFENIRQEHPLLNEIDFQNTTILTKWLYEAGVNEAVWGPLGSTVTKELDGTFSMIDMTLMKLTAFMLIPKDYLELGLEFLDRYARTKLSTALGNGLEKAILTNLDTKTGPVSMRADMSKGNTSDGGKSFTYTAKKAEKINDLSAETFGPLIGKVAKDRNGKDRTPGRCILVVNTGEYYSKFSPASSYFVNGGWVYDKLPYDIKMIPSPYMEATKAIFGIGKNYFMGLGAKKSNPISVSNEYKFLEDQRTYMAKLQGNGQPKDNTSFLLLDVTTISKMALPVTVKGEVTTKAAV